MSLVSDASVVVERTAVQSEPIAAYVSARDEVAATSRTPPEGTRPFGLINGALKRIIDVTIALFLLLVFSPALVAIALMVGLDGGSALYRHRRIGKDLQPFDCLKFRSMMPGAEEILGEYLLYNPVDALAWRREHKLDFDPRVTAIGRVLRATSLDEIPQLLNVLRGDMSLVGPRPITAQESSKYGPTIGFYASVKPGITGLWQVSGRSEVGYESRVALDRCYACIHNVVLDMAILLQTPLAVLSRKGAR